MVSSQRRSDGTRLATTTKLSTSTLGSRDRQRPSGGETFLASLALALSLVEIASRSGTQLDALFLDEGFVPLTRYCLDQALSALERKGEWRAAGGAREPNAAGSS